MDSASRAQQDRLGRDPGMLNNRTMDLVDRAAEAPSAAEVGRRFFSALKPFGVRAIYARCQRSGHPDDVLTFSRISPPGWEAVYAERRFQDNFLIREMRRRISPFRWSDAELRTGTDRELFAMLPAFQIGDGIGAPVHGPGGYVGVTSLAFERMEGLSPDERRAIGMAAVVLHLRMLELTPEGAAGAPRLSPRERDCLGFVAQGKPDWQIAVLLGVSETTVISHVQAARRKLGAKTRSQAVALALLGGLI